jgi:hypothetical protein
MVSEDGVPKDKALPALLNLAEMPSSERRSVLDLYASADPRDRSLAKTKAADLPPEPDPRYIELRGIARRIEQCAGKTPADAFTDEMLSYVVNLNGLAERIQAAYKERINGDQPRAVS